MNSSNNPLYTFDVTIGCDKIPFDDMVKILGKYAKKWVFQKEEGKSGYQHYQIRLSLKYKARITSLFKKDDFFKGGHISRTTVDVHMDNNFNYVMKQASRVEGPWKDTDDQFLAPKPKTRQLSTFLALEADGKLYPWQQQVVERMTIQEDRFINCIIDRDGKSGKSILCEFIEYKNFSALEVPPMNAMEDIMQFCACFPPKKVYLIDMPRALKKDKLSQFYSGLECLKNGRMYDKRYSAKLIRFDRPQIYVFTNTPPNMSYLTPDRWKVWTITCFKKLVPVP